MNFTNYIMNQPDIVEVTKVRRLRWLGHLYRTQEQNPCSKLALRKPEGTRRVDRPAYGWLDAVEEDLKTKGVRNWKQRPQNRDQWRAFIKETKVHHELWGLEEDEEKSFAEVVQHKDDVKVIIYGIITNITRKEGVISYFNHLLRETEEKL